MYTFNDLKRFTRIAKTSVDTIADELGISYDGLKDGLEKQTIKAKNLLPLCNILGITPNQFFGVGDNPGDTIYGSQNKGGKKQIIQQGGVEELKDTIALLKDQLATKDLQIAEKDKQISKLLGL